MQGPGEKEFIYMLNVWCKGSGCIYVQVCLFPIIGNHKVLNSFDLSGVCACIVCVRVCACVRACFNAEMGAKLFLSQKLLVMNSNER